MIAALDGAFAFAQIDDVAVLIAKNLNFDMARLSDKFFYKDAVIAEGRLGFIARELEAFAGFFVVPCNAHTLAAAASRGLDHHRIADFACDLDRLVRIFNQPHMARNGGNTCFRCEFFGGDLVSHGFNRVHRRSDECDIGGFQRFGKTWVFGQKPITRMYGICACFLDCCQNFIDDDIGLV